MRIVGVNIPDEKRAVIALTYVYGIGHVSAAKILGDLNINPGKRAKELTQQEIAEIKGVIEKDYRIEGELKQSVRQNINRLKTIKSYKGFRHAKNLPVHGQSTKRNSRTRRGNVRVTAGSGRKKLTLK